MVFSKIKKHLSILLIRLNQKAELRRMSQERNKNLDLVMESFLDLKYGKKTEKYCEIFQKCEDHRTHLLHDNRLVSYKISGSNKTQTVSEICRKASSKPIWAQFLFLITKKISSPNILEIGTNLGISGAYILSALRYKKNSKFITMEGVSEFCSIADNFFKSITTCPEYEIRQGLYEQTFPIILNENHKFNLFFIDGNHDKNDTIRYFNLLKNTMQFPSIMVFDDINWSVGMQQAWKIITQDRSISYVIDFYKLGIIIIDDLKPKNKAVFHLHLNY